MNRAEELTWDIQIDAEELDRLRAALDGYEEENGPVLPDAAPLIALCFDCSGECGSDTHCRHHFKY
ncbi:MAG: hypothetical protein GX647_11485 [Clostridiales bacterium]|jgi:hypothetical protein|nr:hypothetical protein [Clostridiales bacterium]